MPECPLSGLKLLVVDDDADTRDLFAFLLEENGADVIKAGCVSEAIALFQQRDPDLVISNIMMPDEDGCALMRQIKRLDAQRNRQTPAIAISGLTRTEDRDRALLAGFQTYLTKPVALNGVLNAVSALTGRKLPV
ncbi:response regulator [Oculatella sp. LEGE 06141]|uniref:response regulator n=1 Tax=Oculatella sp. LEGE 06141 TaxID=1828648 RepID=UPI001881D47D|nr:response regulator [Oculatella sp. LEGE 06141]MBE9177422.1 response regulator [Oculatella sp. LEGE 06141]